VRIVPRKRDAHGDTITVEEHERIVRGITESSRMRESREDPSGGTGWLLVFVLGMAVGYALAQSQ
jgi:hypothetical protein